ncbi:MAG: hypothetical protein R2856_40040 [Caldilineaceae bacterium]
MAEGMPSRFELFGLGQEVSKGLPYKRFHLICSQPTGVVWHIGWAVLAPVDTLVGDPLALCAPLQSVSADAADQQAA